MLADRAYKIGGKGFPLVFVAAHRAPPDGFPARRLRLGFYVLLIKIVGARRLFAQRNGVGNFRAEQRVRGKLHRALHFADEKGVGVAVIERVNAVRHFETTFKPREFIRVPARLKAETLDHVERNVLAQYRQIELPRVCDDAVRIIRLVYRDDDLEGIGGDLHKGIVHHAVVLFAVVRRQHVQAVPDFIKRLFIHNFTSFFRRYRPRARTETNAFRSFPFSQPRLPLFHLTRKRRDCQGFCEKTARTKRSLPKNAAARAKMRGRHSESVCKPSSVVYGHLSSPMVAHGIERYKRNCQASSLEGSFPILHRAGFTWLSPSPEKR